MAPRIQRINLPERALSIISQRSSYRENINIPKGYSGFADLSMSILLSSDMREKKLLMAWHDLIISPKNNFHPTYLDDIGGTITIITRGDKNTDMGRPVPSTGQGERNSFAGGEPFVELRTGLSNHNGGSSRQRSA